jgi:hypothetical protein
MNVRICSDRSLGFLRRVILALGTASLLALSGCSAIEKVGYASDIEKGLAVLLQHVKALQAADDPLGDYFYTLGNSDGWIKDVQGDEAITELLRKAAAKGSMDAKILLALQKAGREPVPGKLNEGMDPRGNLVAWEAGLAEPLPLLQKQWCVRRLVVGSRDLSTDLRPHVMRQLGMSEQQIQALTATAVTESSRFGEQGEVSRYLLYRDGSTIAVQQNNPPLREFRVAGALVRSPVEHWREAVALNREALQQLCLVHDKHIPTVSVQVQPEARAMA